MAETTFKLVFIVGFLAGCVIRGICTAPVSRERRREPKESADSRLVRLEWLMMLLVSAGMFILPAVHLLAPWLLGFADYGLPAWPRTTLGVLGTVVFACALWLLWRSHADLGRNWSVRLEIRQGHSLVTEGVYRHIRHPMYAAHWLWAIAQALLLQNWIAGPAFLVTFLPLYLRRVPREEQMMLDSFPEEYRSYVSRTGRVIPRLRRS
ncbi:MAG: protein-S-isoprenylcysteine O-methyltransferase [Planctomycetota bacterium]